jgi:hypothetical protein
MTNIESLINEFITKLSAILESQTIERARHVVESALGVKRAGRPSKFSASALGGKQRKKSPIQLCPVPGCTNPAAPVFGMVCAKHKDVAKTKIKKYREARKAKKLGGKPAKSKTPARAARSAKPAKRRTKKVVRPKPGAASQPAATAA